MSTVFVDLRLEFYDVPTLLDEGEIENFVRMEVGLSGSCNMVTSDALETAKRHCDVRKVTVLP